MNFVRTEFGRVSHTVFARCSHFSTRAIIIIMARAQTLSLAKKALRRTSRT